jgi:hypothetical protein
MSELHVELPELGDRRSPPATGPVRPHHERRVDVDALVGPQRGHIGR